MDEADRDTPLRLAAFDQVRRLAEVHDHLNEQRETLTGGKWQARFGDSPISA